MRAVRCLGWTVIALMAMCLYVMCFSPSRTATAFQKRFKLPIEPIEQAIEPSSVTVKINRASAKRIKHDKREFVSFRIVATIDNAADHDLKVESDANLPSAFGGLRVDVLNDDDQIIGSASQVGDWHYCIPFAEMFPLPRGKTNHSMLFVSEGISPSHDTVRIRLNGPLAKSGYNAILVSEPISVQITQELAP